MLLRFVYYLFYRNYHKNIYIASTKQLMKDTF
jgi:hypothetical protein